MYETRFADFRLKVILKTKLLDWEYQNNYNLKNKCELSKQ